MTPSALRLAEYLETNGILTCNRNPWLPSLENIGCGWTDVTALIDAHALFYCKTFRGRTTYLSPKACFPLRRCRAPRIMTEDSWQSFEALSVGPPLDTKALRWITGLPSKAYAAAFGALLEDMEITAVGNGNVLNPSWSAFLYGTAGAWEACRDAPPVSENPEAALWDMLSRTVGRKDFERLLGER